MTGHTQGSHGRVPRGRVRQLPPHAIGGQDRIGNCGVDVGQRGQRLQRIANVGLDRE